VHDAAVDLDMSFPAKTSLIKALRILAITAFASVVWGT
jgi:hypothetical protein